MPCTKIDLVRQRLPPTADLLAYIWVLLIKLLNAHLLKLINCSVDLPKAEK
jgi:hypothetical protein